MTEDTMTLRKLAEAATPGPWQEEGRDVDHDKMLARGDNPGDSVGLGCDVEGPPEGWMRGQFHRHADAAYIAAANPAAILRLLDRLEAVEKWVNRPWSSGPWSEDYIAGYEAAVADVRALLDKSEAGEDR